MDGTLIHKMLPPGTANKLATRVPADWNQITARWKKYHAPIPVEQSWDTKGHLMESEVV
jgi:hypothetical protein